MSADQHYPTDGKGWVNFLYSGHIIDVPVDEWTTVVRELTAACAACDAEQQVAVQRLGGS